MGTNIFYLYEYLLWQDLFEGTNIFYPVPLTIEFGLLFENLNLSRTIQQWVL